MNIWAIWFDFGCPIYSSVQPHHHEYMCPIFVGDVAEPTNIWGVGVTGIARP
jgi:hypothetical protein